MKQRIPTILGLGVLVVGVVAGLILVQSDTGGFLPRASEDAVPKQVRITNISENSFTVSFITDQASLGYIEYGERANRTNLKIIDDRDQLSNSPKAYLTHHITVRELQPNTQYYFLVGTGTNSAFDNNGEPFSVRTARAENPSGSATAYGIVTNEVGNPANGAIVYLSIQGSSPVSALVKNDGSWALPLHNVRTTDLSNLANPQPTHSVRVQVQGERRDQLVDLTTTVDNLDPLQTIAIGGNNAVVTATPTPTPTPNPSSSTGGFSTLYNEGEAQQTGGGAIDVNVKNNEVINTQRPEFSGDAPAGSYLQIELHSENQYFDVVQTDASGNWQWSPPGDLEPGEHTITLTYTDESGVQQRVQRTFLVQATGSSNLPSFTSSPSGTLATPTPTPTPKPSPSPTPKPTPATTPTPVATVSAQPKQPVSGSASRTAGLVVLSLGFFSLGVLGTKRMMQGKL